MKFGKVLFGVGLGVLAGLLFAPKKGSELREDIKAKSKSTYNYLAICACKADGVEFTMDFETFTCHITPQDVNRWNEVMNAAGDEKKSEPEP